MARDPSYHGTHEHAVRFALEVHDDTLQTYEFLKAWSEGNLDEWPEFYEWLDTQSQVDLETQTRQSIVNNLGALLERRNADRKKRRLKADDPMQPIIASIAVGIAERRY